MLMQPDEPPNDRGSNEQRTARGYVPGAFKEIEANALAAVARARAKAGPYSAEIVPDKIPLWYLVRVSPGKEGLAATHLVARRFGVFVPRFRVPYVSRGKKRSRWSLLFPGYIMLFCWHVEAHMRRLMSCPGVVRVECIDGAPVVVPDPDISRMQLLEVQEGERVEAMDVARPLKRKRLRRRREPSDQGPDVITITTRSYLHGIEELGDVERVKLLQRALGIAQSPEP